MHKHITTLNHSRPFFMTFLSEIGHMPYWYYPFDSDIKMLFPEDKSETARYATQMHFIGEQIAAFIRSAERLPAYRNTIFIVTADHRPHKILDLTALTGRRVDPKDYFHQMPLIPLIIYGPGIVHKNRALEQRPGGQVDLGPTILQLAGIAQGTHRGFGQSLIRRNFNYDRYLMLHGLDAIYDNHAIHENQDSVHRLPVPAGSPWTAKITPRQLMFNYRQVRRCLRDYREYYQQVERLLKPMKPEKRTQLARKDRKTRSLVL